MGDKALLIRVRFLFFVCFKPLGAIDGKSKVVKVVKVVGGSCICCGVSEGSLAAGGVRRVSVKG